MTPPSFCCRLRTVTCVEKDDISEVQLFKSSQGKGLLTSNSAFDDNQLIPRGPALALKMTHIRLVRDVFHTCYHQTFIVV
jgi:hypothetical protein